MLTLRLVSFSLQLITTEKQFLKDSLYNEGILIAWDPSLYHADIPNVSGPPVCLSWDFLMFLSFIKSVLTEPFLAVWVLGTRVGGARTLSIPRPHQPLCMPSLKGHCLFSCDGDWPSDNVEQELCSSMFAYCVHQGNLLLMNPGGKRTVTVTPINNVVTFLLLTSNA